MVDQYHLKNNLGNLSRPEALNELVCHATLLISFGSRRLAPQTTPIFFRINIRCDCE